MHSKVTDSHLPSELQGERGVIAIDHMNPPQKVTLQLDTGHREEYVLPQHSNPMYDELDAFIQLIQNGKTESTINTFELSRKQMGVIFPADPM